MTFTRNEYGHYIIDIAGPDPAVTGAQDIAGLQKEGFDFGPSVGLMLRSEKYNEERPLALRRVYRVAIVPAPLSLSLLYGLAPTMEEVTRICVEQFGYSELCAGLVPCLRRAIADSRMRLMKRRYIIGSHEPILVPLENKREMPLRLGLSSLGSNKPMLTSHWATPDHKLDHMDAVAYLVGQ
jgi:hypothetical protein